MPVGTSFLVCDYAGFLAVTLNLLHLYFRFVWIGRGKASSYLTFGFLEISRTREISIWLSIPFWNGADAWYFALTVLLCRGKAVADFSGPDCRFLSFKKSETIYVYYKLSGRRTDMWAGSVSMLWLFFNQKSKHLQAVFLYSTCSLLVFVDRLGVSLAISQRIFLQWTTFILTKNMKFQQRYKHLLLTHWMN